jgi:hypothetical protein
MQRSREPRFAPYGVCHAPLRFSSRLIYVNARMNSLQRDLTQERSRISMQTMPDEHDELLDCRMAMLGLNLDTTNGDTFSEVMRRCKSCGYRETCAVDLKRDPNNPVWETYCPNTGAFIALAEARRNHETIKSLYKISERF